MPTALVIDDEDAIRDMIRRALEMKGFDVVEAPNGDEAMKHILWKPTDVVITDIYMPTMDGLQFIKTVRADFPDLKIIAISGAHKRIVGSVLEYAKQIGADVLLRKPFTPMDLLNVVCEITEAV